jgi:hypothetical protein
MKRVAVLGLIVAAGLVGCDRQEQAKVPDLALDGASGRTPPPVNLAILEDQAAIAKSARERMDAAGAAAPAPAAAISPSSAASAPASSPATEAAPEVAPPPAPDAAPAPPPPPG